MIPPCALRLKGRVTLAELATPLDKSHPARRCDGARTDSDRYGRGNWVTQDLTATPPLRLRLRLNASPIDLVSQVREPRRGLAD